MPIPTRSGSIHTSQPARRQRLTGQSSNNKNNVFKRESPQGPPSHHSTTSPPPTTSPDITGNGSNISLQNPGVQVSSGLARANTIAHHRKSLLPQRSSSHRRGQSSSGTLQLQQLPQVEEAQPGKTAQSIARTESARGEEESESQTKQQRGQIASSRGVGFGGRAQAFTSDLHARAVPQATKHQTPLQRSASLRQPATSRLVQPTRHARHQSQVVTADIRQSNLRQQKEALKSSAPPTKTAKPKFSTYQQSYTPKKPSRPAPNATSISSTKDVTSASSNPQIGALQIELLQLQLLHSQGLQAKRNWESNTKDGLQKQHASVVESYRSILASEQAAQRYINIHALGKFADDIESHNSRYDFVEQMQMLSRVVQNTADLTDVRGGRYSICVKEFETWFERAIMVKDSRTNSRRDYEEDVIGEEGSMDFVQPLDQEWWDEVASLTAKIELYTRELDCLDVREGGGDRGTDTDFSVSALARIVTGHRSLLTSMLEELEAMTSIEMEILRLERLWVRDLVDQLDDDTGYNSPRPSVPNFESLDCYA